MSDTVQIRERGVLTLPSGIRKRHGIKTGDTYQMLDFDGIFVLTPLNPMVPELAYEIERMRTEAGVSTEELLEGLREQRARYVAERSDEPADSDDGAA